MTRRNLKNAETLVGNVMQRRRLHLKMQFDEAAGLASPHRCGVRTVFGVSLTRVAKFLRMQLGLLRTCLA
jgi:hypothetical protein